MRSGPLRHRIIIECPTNSYDSEGAPTVSWSEFTRRWASIKPATGREYFESHAEQVKGSTEIRMRHVPGITADMRVRRGSRTFDIVSPPIDVNERQRQTILMCDEVFR